MAVAFRTGDKFRFPSDSNIYEFLEIYFHLGNPIIAYSDAGVRKNKQGFYLDDLIKAP